MNAFLYCAFFLSAQTSEPPLHFRAVPNKGSEIVAHLPGALAAKLPLGRLTQERGEAILAVSLLAEDAKTSGPAMLGKYERKDKELIFTPRFPLDAGQTYRASLQLADKTMTLDYRVPLTAKKTPPKVVKIYPTAAVLPANHLKFYIYFDRPMRGGKDLFKQIVLVDDKGEEIDDPWLLDEIWDEENNCLIIYIHPGRIKWGVILRELLGPVLYPNREYALVVRAAFMDTENNKLGADVVKKFRTVAEDRVRVELSDWRLSPPKSKSRESLTLTFPKSLDHRSLQRFLTVTDEQGKRLAGSISIGKDEKSWQFTPAQAWPTSGCFLVVNEDLEDVAGNNPLRPFDRDLNTPKLPAQKLRLEFRPQ